MRSIGEGDTNSALHIDDAHAEAFAADVRDVGDALSIGRPGDVAMRDAGLVRDIALLLTGAIVRNLQGRMESSLLGRNVVIERDDFAESPPKGYFRLFPGNKVRLRHGYVIECKEAEKDAAGNIVAVHADYFPDSKSGTDGANTYKVKGNIHWVSAAHALEAEIRLYDRLFSDLHPDAGGRDFKLALNPNAKTVVTAYLEPGMAATMPEQRFQFERHGYFVADRVDSRPGKPVFNRIATLKDSWVK